MKLQTYRGLTESNEVNESFGTGYHLQYLLDQVLELFLRDLLVPVLIYLLQDVCNFILGWTLDCDILGDLYEDLLELSLLKEPVAVDIDCPKSGLHDLLQLVGVLHQFLEFCTHLINYGIQAWTRLYNIIDDRDLIQYSFPSLGDCVLHQLDILLLVAVSLTCLVPLPVLLYLLDLGFALPQHLFHGCDLLLQVLVPLL